MTVSIAVKSVALSTGVTLQYVEHGEPNGVPVVLLHGVTDSWRAWEPVLASLPSRFHAYALTQRGHGESSKPESGYLVQDFAADVAAFMDAVGLATAVIVGFSMGSAVAQRFAVEHPERLRKLVLMASFYRFDDKPELVEFVEQGIATLEDPIDPTFAREFQESTLAKPISPEQLDTYVSESMSVPARVWQHLFNGLVTSTPPIETNEITAPTLIIWGEHDAYGPRSDQEKLQAAIPASRLVIYEGCGHAMIWEAPERVAADIVAFVEGIQ